MRAINTQNCGHVCSLGIEMLWNCYLGCYSGNEVKRKLNHRNSAMAKRGEKRRKDPLSSVAQKLVEVFFNFGI